MDDLSEKYLSLRWNYRDDLEFKLTEEGQASSDFAYRKKREAEMALEEFEYQKKREADRVRWGLDYGK